MKYDAFISYRHSDTDMYVAKKIHKKLETFKVPSSVTEKTGKKSIKRVFRDQEELPIGSDLEDNIKQALAESEFLIVICSPRTPESYWVQTEIDTFIEMHGREHILAVLVEGEPEESFPKQMLSDNNGNPVEPLAADVRGKSKSEMNKKIRSETVRLAAPLLSCSYDDLRQRHKERQLKKAFRLSLLVSVLAIAFGFYSVYNYITIQKNYKEKQINQSKYLADTAISLLETGDRVTAGLIALEALPSKDNDRPYVANAQYALGETLNIYKNGNELEKDGLLKHDFPVKNILYSQDGTKLASVDNGENVYVWDVEDRTLLTKVVAETNSEGQVTEILGAAVTKENNLVIATESKIYSLDFEGNEIWSVENTNNDNIYISCVYNSEIDAAAWISNTEVSFIDLTDSSSMGSMEIAADKYTFIGQGEFSEDNNKFIAGCMAENQNETSGMVSVYDFKALTETDYITKGSFVTKQTFLPDGNIVVLSEDLKSIKNYSNKLQDGFIEKIDITSKNTVWSNTVKIKLWDLDSSGTNLKCRNYKDKSTGEIHEEVLLSVNNMVYVWNASNGKELSELGVTSGIVDIFISADSDMGYIVESNGIMDTFDLTESRTLKDFSMDISNVLLNNGVFAATINFSPNVVLMKCNQGYGMKEIGTVEDTIEKMDYSLDESCYVLECYDESEKVYHFYNTKDNSLIEKWTPNVMDSIIASRFTGKSDYAVIDSYGNITFYNTNTKEENVLEPKEDMIGCETCFSHNNKYVFVYNADGYYLADLEKQKIIYQKNMEVFLLGGVISEDGKFFYGYVEDTGIICINTETGKYSKFDLAEYDLSGTDNTNQAFSISPDGKFLAVRCFDNKLRILDIKKKKTVDELEFASRTQCFIRFSDDGSKLIMQGDSYYFRVYDIEKHEFTYISKEQINTINNIIYDNGSNVVCVMTASEMLILNEKDYEILAFVDNGLGYMPKNEYVFNRSGNEIYRFPYMNLDMLIKQAGNQFKGVKLTKRERIQYNAD